MKRIFAASALLFSLAIAASVSAQGGEPGECDDPPPIPEAGTLPPGFDSNVFATGLQFLATSAFDNKGLFYVGEAFFAVPAPSQMIWVLEDTDDDGVADIQMPYAGPFGQILGLAFRPRLKGREIAELTKHDTVLNLMRKGLKREKSIWLQRKSPN